MTQTSTRRVRFGSAAAIEMGDVTAIKGKIGVVVYSFRPDEGGAAGRFLMVEDESGKRVADWFADDAQVVFER